MGTLKRQADRLHLRARVDSLTASDQRLWGVMTVAEMLRHLRVAFQMALGETVVRPVPLGMPGGLAKLLVLHMPVPWPKGVRTVPELERAASAAEVCHFGQEHAELQAVLSRFVDQREIRTRHPMFGSMTTSDWMRWGYRHTDHHLRQFGR